MTVGALLWPLQRRVASEVEKRSKLTVRPRSLMTAYWGEEQRTIPPQGTIAKTGMATTTTPQQQQQQPTSASTTTPSHGGSRLFSEVGHASKEPDLEYRK